MSALLIGAVISRVHGSPTESGLDVTFSAYLDQPVSEDSKSKALFVKGGIYRTFSIFCEKGKSECNLWVYDISSEYCNGKSKPESQFASGFNYNNYSNIQLRELAGEFSFGFDDMILYGQTHNEIKVALDQGESGPGGQAIATHVDGIASALNTTQGVPLQARYHELTGKILCTLGFFPPGK